MTTTSLPSQGSVLNEAVVEALSVQRGDPDWVRTFRSLAWRFYEEIPMPTLRDEAWRRTSLRGLDLSHVRFQHERAPTTASSVEDLPDELARQLPATEEIAGLLVHQDGSARLHALRDDLVKRGVVFTDMDAAVREYADLVRPYFMTDAVPIDDNKFSALHAAFWQGGTFLYVPRGVRVDLPLHALIARRASGVGSFPHTLIVVEEGAEVTYVEEYTSLTSGDAGFHDGVVELYVKPGGRLTYVYIQNWARDMWNFSTQRAVLSRDSSLTWIAGNFGSRLTKTFSRVALRAPGANGEMLGLLFADGQQHLDIDTYQDHAAPHCTSNLLYKNVLKDRARTVWRGMIWARPEAQKTDAYQKNENLLLSDSARADAIPGLEIEANDLRCTHGVTAGKIDKDQLFYLMSRGLSEEQAQRMIVYGFFEPLLSRISAESVRARVERMIAVKLGGAWG
ncbi:MAG: Fe-S cluster assembly protein SufB [Anaerolineae bacterium]|nr:Fe-S cluster assembly protein SufB [Anaerolineae bacterium]